MGQALHVRVKTPKIAENFDCLPEQLLVRVRRLTSAPGILSVIPMLQQPTKKPRKLF
jgi:hypothetical protein